MSYNAVPPPSCLGELESEPREEETELQPLDDSGEPVKQRGRQEEKPANISNDHWKVDTVTVKMLLISMFAQ